MDSLVYKDIYTCVYKVYVVMTPRVDSWKYILGT